MVARASEGGQTNGETRSDSKRGRGLSPRPPKHHLPHAEALAASGLPGRQRLALQRRDYRSLEAECGFALDQQHVAGARFILAEVGAELGWDRCCSKCIWREPSCGRFEATTFAGESSSLAEGILAARLP